ncbi:MAG: hypothetical protein GEU83_03085 [Pseudonocardiaceae bacterium]|nr:hypothetical protein [Pseudonocardiaceae bacterium]
MSAASPDVILVCRFAVEPDRITVTATIAVAGQAVCRDSFGWRILTTLADEVEVLGSDGSEGASSTMGLRLRKLHRVVPE